LFIGARDGREFSGTLAESGDYTVHVVLMRPAARRAETAEFSLAVELSGEDGDVGTSETADAPAAPDEPEAAAPTAAAGLRRGVSGHLPCAAVAEAPTVPCAYRATRAGGTALVFITLGNGEERSILFVGGQPVASDRLGAPFSAVRQGNQMLVSIDEERYEIPRLIARGW
jgi:hypothetical protein